MTGTATVSTTTATVATVSLARPCSCHQHPHTASTYGWIALCTTCGGAYFVNPKPATAGATTDQGGPRG